MVGSRWLISRWCCGVDLSGKWHNGTWCSTIAVCRLIYHPCEFYVQLYLDLDTTLEWISKNCEYIEHCDLWPLNMSPINIYFKLQTLYSTLQTNIPTKHIQKSFIFKYHKKVSMNIFNCIK